MSFIKGGVGKNIYHNIFLQLSNDIQAIITQGENYAIHRNEKKKILASKIFQFSFLSMHRIQT